MLQTMLQNINSLTLVQIISLAGIGSFLDTFVPNKRKETIYHYITRQHEVKFGEFESQIITYFLEKLCRKSDINRLSYIKVYIFNAALWFIMSAILLLNSEFQPENVKIDHEFKIYVRDMYIFFNSGAFGSIISLIFKLSLSIVFSIIAAAASFPLDMLSMIVTKRLFYYKVNGYFLFVRNIALDVLLSLCIVFIVFTLVFFIILIFNIFININDLDNIKVNESSILYTVQSIVVFGCFFNFSNNILINIVQVLIVISSSCIRLFSLVFGYKHIIFVSANYPITLIFIVSAIIVILFDAVI